MADTKSPRQWAETKGQLRSWQYAAADQLHFWGDPALREGTKVGHEHHAGAPMDLTEAEYDGAIAAASAPVGDPKPHAPALSQYSPYYVAPKPVAKAVDSKGGA
jgi:hypothetical protein